MGQFTLKWHRVRGVVALYCSCVGLYSLYSFFKMVFYAHSDLIYSNSSYSNYALFIEIYGSICFIDEKILINEMYQVVIGIQINTFIGLKLEISTK